MDRARAIARYGIPPAQRDSIKLNSFCYTYNKHHNQKHLADANEDVCGQHFPLLSRKLERFPSCPISIPYLDYSINVNRGEPGFPIACHNNNYRYDIKSTSVKSKVTCKVCKKVLRSKQYKGW